ncbi:UNVERIFIED_CONTAM: hypothetical protein Scaly_1148900 [Sesamum calycinum]|uniref:Uncharacterized protein n=1 Tax=Sesamum calycinum TaxID=2727403 RepID=A0AAW2QNJ6_9LAMI
MDTEQEEMQFLGFFGIYSESYKLIFRWRKIFSQITLALILPLSFIFLAHQEASEILYWRIRHTRFRLHWTKAGTPKYHKLSDLVTSEWTEYLLLKAVYFVFLIVFSLLCTSAVVYTVASVYTSREVTLKKVLSVVPKVWKRLMVTFLCTFFAFCAYNAVFALTLYLWGATIADSTTGAVVFVIVLTLYAVGFVYMTIIWQLASVVSVGGRIRDQGHDQEQGVFVVYGKGALPILGLGAVCLLLLSKLILFGLVVQTVIYFVCKSYHHENIDKSALSDHLEVYVGDYVPLKGKDIQLKEYA